MEENIPMFNNKILGILIAVVVTATVLIPICNAFSNGNGDDGISPLADDEDGIRVSLVEFSNHSKRYTVHPMERYGEYIIGIEETKWGSNNTPVLYPITLNSYEDSVTVSYDSEYNRWVAEGSVAFGDFSSYAYGGNDGRAWIFDDNGNYILHLDEVIPVPVEIDMADYVVGHISTTFGDDRYWDWISWNVYGTELAYYPDRNAEYQTVTPTISNEDGILTISGGYGMGSVQYPLVEASLIAISGGDSSDGPTPGGNGGISSTLIGIIPVFVILAILGSVAYMLIGKNEIQ